ncbi:Emc2p NDAI_0J00710 [Naumovozyma dairenensis CBS 421]|uniref:ER membrane protein complex subunit 2 n=1 Tax=Naumovozyma dairenensis (strain ATCC 10597 / BCRC 20456 / CBS 421 / NBRC 0211 / NRRL Y-12639) TaxID=1071378 RepID=G0WGN5_NAUDC|nr:hypothetical protein NDAI_0J00710 [Naumovozyma dairenensis CBS 421]CCD26963.1 hypothetical protein NDAI_0J00710 [Naumovozyma dairenensis CBS 421]
MMQKDSVREKLLTIMVSKSYTQLPPKELIELYSEMKNYLAIGDSHLSESNGLSLTEMLFYVCVYLSKDVEAQIHFNALRDRFGESSPKLQIMKATLLQINQNDDVAIQYLESLINRQLEFESDTTSYTMVMKKLISIKIQPFMVSSSSKKGKDEEKDKGKVINELLKLVDKFPLDPETWWFMGEVYFQLKDYHKAKYCFEEILIIMPFNYEAFARLSEVLYYQALTITNMNSSSRKLSEYNDLLEKSLQNALRSVEISEYYIKGWIMAYKTTQLIVNGNNQQQQHQQQNKTNNDKLENRKKKLEVLNLSKAKLQEISSKTSVEQDKITIEYVLRS